MNTPVIEISLDIDWLDSIQIEDTIYINTNYKKDKKQNKKYSV
ncbi:hypothetical protein [Crassaminicella thermophila]|nr:hypothetical protein [Crassaminicella thermophila]